MVAERNFDPFGKPRAASGSLKFNAQLGDYKSAKTRRGFTDHEHLDDLELIHMNGRVYDYNLGRFMSVDPVIQSPGNSQSINPYSYIMNNPLGGTDPTGYSSACQSKGADVSGDSA
ncbi:RHS repeat-associated core domain-containing protein, partial [Pseudoalteromonas rubra]|uniref:RHS repeat domain-containing protein n=1 Tax=Pseudoalteromonas rubra TaxID=43658 RepID=UPI002DBC5FC1